VLRLTQDLTKPVSLKPVEFNMPKFTPEELARIRELKQELARVRGPRGGLDPKFRAMEFELVKLEGRS